MLKLFKCFQIQSLVKKLDQIETQPVIFSKTRDKSFDDLLEEIYLSLSRYQDNEEVMQRFTALLYRLESANGGLDPVDVRLDMFGHLQGLARAWKQACPLIQQKILTFKDLNKLKTTTRYPLFSALLLKFPQLRTRYFDWTLRDGNEGTFYIQFPAACELLTKSLLSGRTGYHGDSSLRIIKSGQRKLLELMFEGRYESILDTSKVLTFRGGYQLSIKEIFNVFAHKETEVGNFEFMRDGVVNWNIHQLGYWDIHLKRYISIDLKVSRWWEQMPALEVLNRKKLFKRYGIKLKNLEWIAAAVSTRGKPNLDYDGTHSYLEVAIPIAPGSWSIYDFGKLATEYPKTSLDRLLMLTKTTHAAIAHPDDNVYYTERQKGFYPFVLSNIQGNHLMNIIKGDIEMGQKRNLVYQIESENCAKWVYSKLIAVLDEGSVPDFFRMQLLDTEPQGPVLKLFQLIKKLPVRWQVPLLAFLHLPLGAMRTIWVEEDGVKVPKSLTRHAFFKTGQIFLPALLIHKLKSISSYKFFYINKRSWYTHPFTNPMGANLCAFRFLQLIKRYLDWINWSSIKHLSMIRSQATE